MAFQSQTSFVDYLKLAMLWMLPKRLLCKLMFGLSRTHTPLTALFIRWYIRHYTVDMAEALEPDPRAYPNFDAFFTRALAPGTRPIINGEQDVACPADGTVAQIGRANEGHLIQSKRHHYSVLELFGGDQRLCEPFRDGHFINIYLSPRDCHRVHMPIDGRLTHLLEVPGQIFSVAPHAVRLIPKLYARSERVIAVFDTPTGRLALVMIAALNVSAIETSWSGILNLSNGQATRRTDYSTRASPVSLLRGQEAGCFHIGSSVLLLFEDARIEWNPAIAPDCKVKVGQHLASYS